jgi:hypothetical protein
MYGIYEYESQASVSGKSHVRSLMFAARSEYVLLHSVRKCSNSKIVSLACCAGPRIRLE